MRVKVKVVPKFIYLRLADDIEIFLTIKQAVNLLHDSECTRKW